MSEAFVSSARKVLEELIVYTPSNTCVSRVRAGSRGDGGYVLLDYELQNLERFYSYGISDNYSFDSWLYRKTGALGRLFDPTVDYPPLFDGALHFRKLGLGVAQGTVEDHIKMFKDMGRRMLLKVDIEGCEREWLSETTGAELGRFDHILLELHDLQDPNLHGQIVAALKLINRHFFLVHVHANNFYPLFKCGPWHLPGILECTYVRKDLVQCDVNRSVVFPVPELDMPNIAAMPDVPLGFWPFLSGQTEQIEEQARKTADLYIEAHNIITMQRRRIKQLTFELEQLKSSVSWKFGAPLRFAFAKYKALFGQSPSRSAKGPIS